MQSCLEVSTVLLRHLFVALLGACCHWSLRCRHFKDVSICSSAYNACHYHRLDLGSYSIMVTLHILCVQEAVPVRPAVANLKPL